MVETADPITYIKHLVTTTFCGACCAPGGRSKPGAFRPHFPLLCNLVTSPSFHGETFLYKPVNGLAGPMVFSFA